MSDPRAFVWLDDDVEIIREPVQLHDREAALKAWETRRARYGEGKGQQDLPGIPGPKPPGDNTKRGKVVAVHIDEDIPERVEKIFGDADNALPQIQRLATDLAETLPGDYTLKFRAETYSDDIQFQAMSQNGTSITRTIGMHDGELVVHHDYFKLAKSEQGEGVGKDIMRIQMEAYENMGVDRVETYANIDVGGYAWARYGFTLQNPDDESEMTDLRQMILNNVKRFDTRERILASEAAEAMRRGDEDTFQKKESERKALRALLNDPEEMARLKGTINQALGFEEDEVYDEHLAPEDRRKRVYFDGARRTGIWDISDYRTRAGTKIGFYLLEEAEWNAVLHLNDVQAMRRVKKYIGKD